MFKRRIALAAGAAAAGLVLVFTSFTTAQADPGRGYPHGKDCPTYGNGADHGKKKGDVNHKPCVTTTTAPETTTTLPETTTTIEVTPTTTPTEPTVVITENNVTVNSSTDPAPVQRATAPPAVPIIATPHTTG